MSILAIADSACWGMLGGQHDQHEDFASGYKIRERRLSLCVILILVASWQVILFTSWSIFGQLNKFLDTANAALF